MCKPTLAPTCPALTMMVGSAPRRSMDIGKSLSTGLSNADEKTREKSVDESDEAFLLAKASPTLLKVASGKPCASGRWLAKCVCPFDSVLSRSGLHLHA